MFVMNAQRWKQSLCIPKDVSIGQVADVVKKYLVVHPEERHFQAPRDRLAPPGRSMDLSKMKVLSLLAPALGTNWRAR